MSDQPLSPDHDLASAFVDGLATAPERAQVEASPELMALVQSFQAQRAALAAVPAVSDSVREAAFVAAFAAFDGLSATSDTTSPQVAAVAATAPVAPPTNVVSLERHRRWNRVLGAAAAVAVIGLAGVAVANLGTGSSNDSASMSSEVVQEADTKVGLAGVTDPSNLSPTIDPSQPAVLDTIVRSDGSTDTTAGSPGTIDSIDGGGSAVPALSDTSSLRSLPPPTNEVSPSFVLDCPLTSDQTIVLEITWRGTPAVVVRDTVSGVITVLDAQCNTLVTVAN